MQTYHRTQRRKDAEGLGREVKQKRSTLHALRSGSMGIVERAVTFDRLLVQDQNRRIEVWLDEALCDWDLKQVSATC